MTVRRFSKTQWLVLLLLVLTAVLGAKVFQLSRDFSRFNADQAQINQTALVRTAFQAQQSRAGRAVVDPLNSSVYLPEFKIKLPYDNLSKLIVYSMRNDSGVGGATAKSATEADVSLTSYSSIDQQTQIDCSAYVRLKVEAKPNPYSPHEKPLTVSLSDGRKLQVYESVNVKECATAWNSSTYTPTDLANEFKKAMNY